MPHELGGGDGGGPSLSQRCDCSVLTWTFFQYQLGIDACCDIFRGDYHCDEVVQPERGVGTDYARTDNTRKFRPRSTAAVSRGHCNRAVRAVYFGHTDGMWRARASRSEAAIRGANGLPAH